MKVIDAHLQQIQISCDHLLTKEQLEIIREEMETYALAACLDSDIREELFNKDKGE